MTRGCAGESSRLQYSVDTDVGRVYSVTGLIHAVPAIGSAGYVLQENKKAGGRKCLEGRCHKEGKKKWRRRKARSRFNLNPPRQGIRSWDIVVSPAAFYVPSRVRHYHHNSFLLAT